MFLKCLRVKLFLRFPSKSCSSSVLYVTGDRATEQVSVISPHLDFDRRFRDRQSLVENVKKRNMNLSVQKFALSWELLKSLYHQKETIEKKRVENAALRKQLNDEKEKEMYRHRGKLIKEELRNTSKAIWELEEQIIPLLLKLPNDLHSLTPIDCEVCIYQKLEDMSKNLCSESHLQVGKTNLLIEWRDVSCFYLLNDAAMYTNSIMEYISSLLIPMKFVQVSNSDFVRSVIVEGCGMCPDDPNVSFLLKDPNDPIDQNRLHLVGSASLSSFCCLHAKTYVSADSLPLKYFSVGQLYNPIENSVTDSLFNTFQESAISIFVATPCLSETMEEFHKLTNNVTEFYKLLNYDFKVIYVPASKLNSTESIRVSFQVYSPFLKTFVEVGNLAVYGSFISKRLLMCFQNSSKQFGFLNILSGTLVSVPKLIGCAIEQDISKGNKILDLQKNLYTTPGSFL